MRRWTPDQIATEAASLDAVAANSHAAAVANDLLAADARLGELQRAQAAARAQIQRQHARDMRADAAALRGGVHPADLGYVD